MQFALAYPYSWHTYGKDRSTTDAVAALVRDGLLQTNEHRQFRLNVPDRYFAAMGREASR